MRVLVANAGSTSLKFKLYDMPAATVLARAKIERVGSDHDAIFQYANDRDGYQETLDKQDIPSYTVGIARFLERLCDPVVGVISEIRELDRVGFKATASKGFLGVHEITTAVEDGMRAWLPIAPLHNQAYLDTIAAMRSVLPDAVFLGAFETAFHRDIPLSRRLYAVPYAWYEQYGVERLGYHSASHGYIADRLNALSPRYQAVSLHLGGSSSACAIRDGFSVDTTFGMSLQSGLPHAARVGDMDPDLFDYLKAVGLSEADILNGMRTQGGLLGISGVSSDMRYIETAAEAGNTRAQLAIDLFVDSIVRAIGAFHVELEGLTHLIFTAGIGENSPVVRKAVCQKLGVLGVQIDMEKNADLRGEGIISRENSRVTVLVIPTDEELGIARRTFNYTKEV